MPIYRTFFIGEKEEKYVSNIVVKIKVIVHHEN